MMDTLILLVYRTPTGRRGQRHVLNSKLEATLRDLTRRGYTGCRASRVIWHEVR